MSQAPMKKRNTIAKDLYTPKYAPRVVKSKKGKGSYKRIKISKKLDTTNKM